jgi:hypothetical protein
VISVSTLAGIPPVGADAQCVGDCTGDIQVTVDEIITMVNVSLEATPLSACAVGDANGDGFITIDEIIQAVNNARNGCIIDHQICGNGNKDVGEDCDDGGTCVGGVNAGMDCTADSQCVGNGACVGGAKIGTSCAADTDCPGSRCVHCRTFGGDGCAANCTAETTIALTLVPGVIMGLDLKPGTSAAVVHGDVLTIPLPLIGMQDVVVGKMSADGIVPFVVPADSVKFPEIPVATLACACVRGVRFKTCGGTLFETTGSQSPSCTDDFLGKTECPIDKPCAFVHGAGNSATGILGCGDAGLPGADISLMQDSGGEAHMAGSVIVTFSSIDGPLRGSAVVINSMAIGVVVGSCAAAGAAFCTDDEPIDTRGTPQTLPLTTGTATCKVTNANGQVGIDIGPRSLRGSPANCDNLNGTPPNLAGFGLVGAFPALGQPTLGDICVTIQFFFH